MSNTPKPKRRSPEKESTPPRFERQFIHTEHPPIPTVNRDAADKATKAPLQFVHLDTNTGPTQDVSTRHMVRAHVMKDFQMQKHAREELEWEEWRGGGKGKEKEKSKPKLPEKDEGDILGKPRAETMTFVSDDGKGKRVASQQLQTMVVDEEQDFEMGTGTTDQRQGRQPRRRRFSTPNVGKKRDTKKPRREALPPARHHKTVASSSRNQMSSATNTYESGETLAAPLIYLAGIGEMISSQIEKYRNLSTPNTIGPIFDPFDAVPIADSPRLQRLMHYYNTVLVNTLIPVNPKDKWFNHAITDPALFHATMLHAAAHHMFLSRSGDLSEQWRLKRETIALVNQSLSDPIQSVSDVTIGAVVCLVLFENQSGNVEASNIHMDGLQRMINLRGGLSTLGLSGVLKRKILWADLCNAMLSLSQPHFNLSEPSQLPQQPLHQEPFMTAIPPDFTFPLFDHPPTILSLPSSSHFQDGIPTNFPPQSCTCSSQLLAILSELRSLSSIHSLTTNISGTLSDRIYLAERHLFTLLTTSDPLSCSIFPSSLSTVQHTPLCNQTTKPCAIAGLIYTYNSLRDFPLSAPIFTTFASRLTTSLPSSSPSYPHVTLPQTWSHSPSLLLWVLTMGAISASGRKVECEDAGRLAREAFRMEGTMREIFIGEIARVCGILEVWSLEGLKEELRGVVWVERQDREGREGKVDLGGLWREVVGVIGSGF